MPKKITITKCFECQYNQIHHVAKSEDDFELHHLCYFKNPDAMKDEDETEETPQAPEDFEGDTIVVTESFFLRPNAPTWCPLKAKATSSDS